MPRSIDEISGQAGAEILLCLERRRLLEEFTAAVHEAMVLQQQQVTEIVNDYGDDFSRFDVLVHMANEKKAQAKYAYLQHVEEHGC